MGGTASRLKSSLESGVLAPKRAAARIAWRTPVRWKDSIAKNTLVSPTGKRPCARSHRLARVLRCVSTGYVDLHHPLNKAASIRGIRLQPGHDFLADLPWLFQVQEMPGVRHRFAAEGTPRKSVPDPPTSLEKRNHPAPQLGKAWKWRWVATACRSGRVCRNGIASKARANSSVRFL